MRKEINEMFKNNEYSILVNRENKCPDNLNFTLVDSYSKFKSGILVEKLTFEHWKEFQKQALIDGYEIEIESAYRSKDYQENVMNEIINEKGLEHALKYVAKPGYSEHQTGLAIDVCLKKDDKYLIDHDLINLDLPDYISNNAYKFGFIVRYPKGKEHITKYNYEPWHLRYIGIKLAKYLYDNDLSLEEYYKNLNTIKEDNMKMLDNVIYDKINYDKYRINLRKLLDNPQLKKLGLKHNILGFTTYNYPIDAITIGYGEKEMFVVGGTHGSEIIGVDFIMQLINSIPNMLEFNPDLYKITFIPIQNPEGFDISSNTFKNIDDSMFREKAYEYYERYRTDSLISIAMSDLNTLIHNMLNSNSVISADLLLASFKKFINENKNWGRLNDARAIPQIDLLNKMINNINSVDSFNDLKNKLINILDAMIINLDFSNLKDQYFMLFLNEFKEGFSNELIWKDIDNKNKIKLHQKMFEKIGFDNIDNKKLKEQVIKLYNDYPFPDGSQIIFDANGNGINLNANTLQNPGIELLKNDYVTYGSGVRNNVPRYFKGPIGAPTMDINNFEYEKENKILFNLLEKSYNNGNYLSTFLYHGTGGMIYYKPEETAMNSNDYNYFYKYNRNLAEIYSDSTKYNILEVSGVTGYGDFLRRTFPGVLLIELSKMGGNPIGPYGDYNNIYSIINDNVEAFKNVLNFYNELLKTDEKNYFL